MSQDDQRTQLAEVRQKLETILEHIGHAQDWDSLDQWRADTESILNDKSIPWGTCGRCEYLEEMIGGALSRFNWLLCGISQAPSVSGVMAFRAPSATAYAMAQDAVADLECAVKDQRLSPQSARDAARFRAGAVWALRHLANEIGLGPFPQYSPLIGHLLASADRIERGEVEVPNE